MSETACRFSPFERSFALRPLSTSMPVGGPSSGERFTHMTRSHSRTSLVSQPFLPEPGTLISRALPHSSSSGSELSTNAAAVALAVGAGGVAAAELAAGALALGRVAGALAEAAALAVDAVLAALPQPDASVRAKVDTRAAREIIERILSKRVNGFGSGTRHAPSGQRVRILSHRS